MAEPNGEIAVRDPDSLVKEIERTRESLARTIDALTEHAAPWAGRGSRRAVLRPRSRAGWRSPPLPSPST
jgi:hypothetical protein